MFQDLERSGIKRLTATKVVEITAAGIRVQGPEGDREIAADTVVLAAGAGSYDPLTALLTRKGIIHVKAGDANKVAQAIDAVHQGFQAGFNI
jgi:2,4-dienoyl-CoA reductase (NADPH2)